MKRNFSYQITDASRTPAWWATVPPIPILFAFCPQMNLLTPPRTKFLGTPLARSSSKRLHCSHVVQESSQWPAVVHTIVHLQLKRLSGVQWRPFDVDLISFPAQVFSTVTVCLQRQPTGTVRWAVRKFKYRVADKSLARTGRKQARKHVRDA